MKKLETRTLGNSGIKVSAIGLGGMPLSIVGRPEPEQAFAVIKAAVEAGITFIDTADVYCLDDNDIGHNERLIASALKELGADHVVVATKGGLHRPNGDWTTDGRPEHLKAACDLSLTALGVDAIELYQLHAPDSEVTFADTVGALRDLRDAGKVKHVGLSNVSVAQIQEAGKIVPIASVQNRCNLFDTDSFKSGVVAHCIEEGIAFLPHSPVGGHRGHGRTTEDEDVLAISAQTDATPHQVLLAWLLGVDDVVIPIPGASRVESAVSSAQVSSLRLPTDAQEKLSRRAGLG